MPTIPVPLPPEASSVYDALASVDAYATARGNAEWAAATPESQAVAKVKAAAWMDGLQWAGVRATRDQQNAWGRKAANGGNSPFVDAEGNAWQADEIPQAVLDAFCEMAVVYLAVTSGDTADPLAPLAERDMVTTSEKIDVLSFSYAEGQYAAPLVRDTSATGYPAIDGMLWPFLKNATRYGQVEVHRG